MKKWQHFSFPQNVNKSIFGIKIAKFCFPLFMKKVKFGIKIVKKCFPLFVKKVIFGVNITKYQELVRSVNFFENIIFGSEV